MQILRSIIYIIFLLTVASCKKNDANRSKCIYDHRVFSEIAIKAVDDEREFLQFKRNPFFNLLWENLTFEEGEHWLQKIVRCFPELKPHFDQFRIVDSVGSPRVFSYAEAGLFSPSTLRLIALTGGLREKLGSCENTHFVQIGAGLGSWCKMIYDAYGFESYTMIDLPEQLELAKKCLEKWGVTNVKFYTPDGVPNGVAYDIVISDMSFSEFNRSYQKLLLSKVIFCSDSGFILGHEFPKHFGVISMNFDELQGVLDQKKNLCELDKPSQDEGGYFICWKKGGGRT